MQTKPRRTFLLYLLVIAWLALAWFGGLRLYSAMAHFSTLSGYLSDAMLVYIAVGGAVWALAGLAAGVTLWLGLRLGVRLSKLISAVCFIWYWLDFLLLTRTSPVPGNLPFMITATLLALGLAWLIPALPGERAFLTKS